ncbi:MAG: aspartate carbamoyltransferase [Anaerolineae bacterium]|nr:aspartate carbamoyltransferase [Anaerolineae bacterium]
MANPLTGRDVIEIPDLTREDVHLIVATARDFEERLQRERVIPLLEQYILATLFYEPSTRTRLSFEAAMHRLGGRVISVAEVTSSSVSKGESIDDTVRTIEQYADVIVMRHPEAGAAHVAAAAIGIPLINAGDGSRNHPTQALLDLYTIEKERGSVDGQTIALVGDLKYGRTTHSLAEALVHYQVQLLLVSPAELRMPERVLQQLQRAGVEYRETEDIEEAVRQADVLYLTRIQRERFPSPADYDRFQGVFHVDPALAARSPRNATVMHPLPRVDEISHQVDALPQAAYFRQARNGVYVRMALLALVLGAV